MARTVYSPETKAAALAALLQGQSVRGVATEYRIPVGTVMAWSAELRRDPEVMPSTSHAVAIRKKEEIGHLLLEYLHTNLETLRQQSLMFRDPKWLQKQSAEGVAVLHGVLTDKTIRLLEALSAAANPPL